MRSAQKICFTAKLIPKYIDFIENENLFTWGHSTMVHHGLIEI